MNNTLKTLSTIAKPEFQEMNLEELAAAYIEELNPSILAAAFCKTFKLILDVSRKYAGLSNADIASLSLETLDKCLQTYAAEQAAFSTYFTTVLRNKFRQETQGLSTDKRKAIFYSNSLEVMMENGYDVGTESENYNEDLIEQLMALGLTERELCYCRLILDGYSNKEISDMFHISVMTLCNMRKKLRVKLSPLCLQTY